MGSSIPLVELVKPRLIHNGMNGKERPTRSAHNNPISSLDNKTLHIPSSETKTFDVIWRTIISMRTTGGKTMVFQWCLARKHLKKLLNNVNERSVGEILDHHSYNGSWNYHNTILASCRTMYQTGLLQNCLKLIIIRSLHPAGQYNPIHIKLITKQCLKLAYCKIA